MRPARTSLRRMFLSSSSSLSSSFIRSTRKQRMRFTHTEESSQYCLTLMCTCFWITPRRQHILFNRRENRSQQREKKTPYSLRSSLCLKITDVHSRVVLLQEVSRLLAPSSSSSSSSFLHFIRLDSLVCFLNVDVSPYPRSLCEGEQKGRRTRSVHSRRRWSKKNSHGCLRRVNLPMAALFFFSSHHLGCFDELCFLSFCSIRTSPCERRFSLAFLR